MVQSCSASNCTERSKRGTGISFHQFPRDPLVKRQWVVAMGIENFNPSPYSRICSKHFTCDSFITNNWSSIKKLKNDAVPSIFNFSDDLTKKITGKPSPSRKIKVKNKDHLGTSKESLVETLIKKQKQIKILQQQNRRLTKRVNNLQSLLENLKQEQTIDEDSLQKFSMESDVKNYMQYKMGFSMKLKLANGVVPSKFDCQQDHSRRIADPSTSRAGFAKRKKIDLFEASQKETDAIKKNVSTQSDPEDLSEMEKMDLENEIIKRKVTYHHKKRSKHSKTSQLCFSKTKTLSIIAVREQNNYTSDGYASDDFVKDRDQSENLLESSEIKIEEHDIKQEVLEENLLNTDPSLNSNVNFDRMAFNSIDGESVAFNTASNETSLLNTEWNGNVKRSEFVNCGSVYDGTIYNYSETLQEDLIDTKLELINDVDINTQTFNVNNEHRTVGSESNGTSSLDTTIISSS